MNLQYPTIEENLILSSEPINLQTINKILCQLATNDLMLADPAGSAPRIWECKWYNDDKIEGYPAGYAVWMNTESPEQFIAFNADKIYEYAKHNPYLLSKIEPFSNANYDLYYNILTGYQVERSAITLPPLFDIGELSAPVLIRVSKIDNNKKPVSDDTAWKDFIIRDEYKSVIDTATSMLSTIFANHMQEYHFGNGALSNTLSNYSNIDLTNLTNVQKYLSHTLKEDTSGFDYVSCFVKLPFYEIVHNAIVDTIDVERYWKLKSYSAVANKNGRITSNAKSSYRSLLSGCNNYLNNNIEESINGLVDTAIINIKYNSATSVSLVPNSTTKFEDISANIQLYNCTYDIVPLTAATSADIAQYVDWYNYNEVSTINYYPEVQYTYNKWFRLWKSGLLEHGGTIPISAVGNIPIRFDWSYINKNNLSVTAPIYNYPETIRSFYGSHSKFLNDKSSAYDYNENIISKDRYTVNLTPITVKLVEKLEGNSESYSAMPDKNGNYMCNEANSFKNNGFCIYVENMNAKYYSYYVRGYKTDL